MSIDEKCPYCGCSTLDLDCNCDDEIEEHGCGGYGSDYAGGSEQCDWCPDRDSCAKLSKGDN